MGRAGVHITSARLGVLLGGPVALAVASWIYLGLMIGDMSMIPGMAAMMMPGNTFAAMPLFGLFLMWAVMMAAMMLPTAAPMIIAYARMHAVDRARGAGWQPVLLFAAGYVLAWAGFSLAAAVFQAGLTHMALMSPMMMKAGSGPRPGWQEWAAQTGDSVTSVPNYRFDNYVSAHSAAKAGLGVVLGSLPLSAQDLASKDLVRLSDKSLRPDAGYWMTANEDMLSRKNWDQYVRILCDPDEKV